MKWYAVQTADYTDWDDGSHDYNEAVKMAEQYIADGQEGVKIAVINEETSFCEAEIMPEDF